MIKIVLIVVIGLTMGLNYSRKEDDHDIFGFRKKVETPAASSQTFMCRSCTGRQVFTAPMVTRAFLDSMTNFERNLAVAKKFQEFSYCPAKMLVEKSQSNISVVLEGFVCRPRSKKNS